MPLDYSEYPDKWKEISEYIRFERAGNKCETCGVPNYETIYRPDGDSNWELAQLNYVVYVNNRRKPNPQILI